MGLVHMCGLLVAGGQVDSLVIPFYLSPLTWCPLDPIPGELNK